MTPTPSADPELIKLLSDEPRLLEVADAIAAHADRREPSEPPSTRPLAWALSSRRSRRMTIVLVIATALVALVVPAALAFGGQIVDFLGGEPVPTTVSQTFSEWNQMFAMQGRQPSLGVFAKTPFAL